MNFKLSLIWIAFLAVFPILVRSDYLIYIGILAGLYGIMAMSMDLLLGYCGQWSLAAAAFYGLGAYASALLSMRLNLSPLLTIPIAALFTGLIGLLLSLTAVRLSGLYLAIISLGFGVAVHVILVGWVEVTNGGFGLYGIPEIVPIGSKEAQFYVMLLVYTLSLLAILKLVKSNFGLRIVAIREDEALAKALGINTNAYKAICFTIAASFQGLAGAFIAHFLTVIGPELADPATTTLVVASTFIGGLGTMLGPAIFTFVLWFATESLRAFSPYLRVLITGLVLILTIKFFRAGVLPTLSKLLAHVHFTKKKK